MLTWHALLRERIARLRLWPRRAFLAVGMSISVAGSASTPRGGPLLARLSNGLHAAPPGRVRVLLHEGCDPIQALQAHDHVQDLHGRI